MATPVFISLSVGRDQVLAPKQADPPLNFFVYPYAGADGKPIAADQFKRRISVEDVE